MVLCLILVGLLASAPAAAAPSLEALHEEAQLAAALGAEDHARRLLSLVESRLLAGESMPAELAVSSLALLADLRLRAGDAVGAAAAFRLLAGRFPDAQICPGPRESPPARAPPAMPDLETTLPAWSYTPLGIPQLHQQRPGAALAWGAAQLVAGGISLAVYAQLNGGRGSRQDRQAARNNLQVPATLAFYGLWAGSHLDARWYERQRDGISRPASRP